jgi:hypothetical protein
VSRSSGTAGTSPVSDAPGCRPAPVKIDVKQVALIVTTQMRAERLSISDARTAAVMSDAATMSAICGPSVTRARARAVPAAPAVIFSAPIQTNTCARTFRGAYSLRAARVAAEKAEKLACSHQALADPARLRLISWSPLAGGARGLPSRVRTCLMRTTPPRPLITSAPR